METLSKTQTYLDETKTILYFYVGFHDKSGLPRRGPFDYRFLDALCEKYRVIVALFTRGRRVSLPEEIAPANVEFLFINDFPLPSNLPTMIRWPIQTIARILHVALLVRTLKPDLVNGNWITRSSGFYCAASGFHPFLATAWGSDILVEAKRSRILRMLGRFTVRRADAVIVDSEVQRKAVLMLGCNPSKIYSFPWGIDLETFRPEKSAALRKELGWSDARIIVSTRMHYPTYGIETLIRAIPIILQKVENARFLIIGDGPLLQRHKSLAKELGVEHAVKFFGLIPNDLMPAVLNSADIYVSTSFSDGTSASLLEALACGLPVVVTGIPANQEWIRNGRNGFLVPPADNQTLAEHITSILQSEDLKLRMSEENVKLARERADWKRNSLIFQKCISDLLGTSTEAEDSVKGLALEGKRRSR